MKRTPKSVTIPSGYAEAWTRLFSRPLTEIEAERQARMPAPPPQTPGSRKGAKSAPRCTQAAPAAHSSIQRKGRGNHER